ncbi:hypothetical protein PVT67_08515 [Gallaecimonas kandeliae]|uniref:hypothetical protein n=1 Tax=Gallaecimonas kandeliae TaxID=3029055 RepID=UPI002647C8DC|nr:hypothetical protein [Gallaecimonas kandeliae]WKE67263.1 hypothetical protein PVT67_08515 [Gallaecimonas kandeliae]
MDTVQLRVTNAVMEQAVRGRHQEQIAISGAVGAFDRLLRFCNREQRIMVRLAGALDLVIGDTSAIWRSHQESPADFDSLYALLASKPDTNFTLPVTVIASPFTG